MSAQHHSEPLLPKRIERLQELSQNLWWSWNEEGRQLFRSLDYEVWRNSGQNPVKQLREIRQERIETAATDQAFLELYDATMQKFDSYMTNESAWCNQKLPHTFNGQIAYFSPEYAIHNSLPIYAGGLGILAGDICKEASDLGLPLSGVGFMYPQGYFQQRMSAEGDQQEVYTQLDFGEIPISPCAWPQACGPLIPVQLADRQLHVQVWQVNVGRTRLYLLDTNVKENDHKDRTLSARLYTADQEERICQLITLGIGGVRTLRELRINPIVWHANEDHTAFMMLERLREECGKGLSLQSAIERVRRSTIFTTHTPVQAGHHIFPHQLIDQYLQSFCESIGIDRESFLRLGHYEGLEPGKFSLTAFALRLSGQSNAVSKLHGGVARKIWRKIWQTQEENHITYVTNGVHLPSWQAPEIAELCERQLGKDWRERQTDRELWNCVVAIPDEQFWQLRQKMKNRLLTAIQERAQKRWTEGTATTQQVIAMGSLLDPYALTIVFSRRFAEYKRPYLIFSDPERLEKIVTNPLRPVQIVFAGKSHPADFRSKQLLKRTYQLVMDRRFQGRIAFLEDYDMMLARELVRGADVWLNNPRRLQEACGTSGMKASMNGVINLSVRDGWWDEAYNGFNGWAIDNFQGGSPADEDRNDFEALYHLLENRIVPLYYERDRKGIPHQWIKIAKDAIRTISPTYNACRMMKEYTERMYLPATENSSNTH